MTITFTETGKKCLSIVVKDHHVSLAAVGDAADQALHALSTLGGGADQPPDTGDHVPGDPEVGDGDPGQGAGGGQHRHQAAGERLGDGVQTGSATLQTSAIRAHIEHLAPHQA